jgi:AbrB family looped-hinge helix DNA binding protein
METARMSATTTLSSKFQISIPKGVREEQAWQAGQQFVFIPKGKGMWQDWPRTPSPKPTATARTGSDAFENFVRGGHIGMDRVLDGFPLGSANRIPIS